jgi:Protein of unknown function, DUF481
MLWKGFLSFCLCLAAFACSAQIVNIENKRIYEDTSGWSGSLDGNFSVTQNGDMLFAAGIRPKVQYKTRKNYFLLISDVIYAASAKSMFANQGMSHFRYARRIKNSSWKWESYTQIQYNQLLNQRVRYLVGTGLRWKFVDTNNVRFFVGSSTLYEYEELTEDGIINQDFRWSNYLSWFIHTKSGFSFTGITYYQPRWDKFKDYRFAGQYSLSQSINKRLDIRFELNIFYDAEPPTNVRSTVFSSTAGFRVRLGE